MTEVMSQMDRIRNLAKGNAEPKETDDEYSAFASGRVGTKPQLTLIFSTVARVCYAFSYAHLYSMEYDPSKGITLEFSQHRVSVRGSNLDQLFRYLCSHRIQTVQETDLLHAETLPTKMPCVTNIEVIKIGQ